MFARSLFFVLFTSLLSGCTGLPDKVTPIETFELSAYLGRWYEVARLDHSFERGLTQVSAEYSMLDDGGVRVLNSGYSAEKGEWKQAEGKAYFVGEPNIGHLKVSFFGPFYSSYVIFDLDDGADEFAYISGFNKDYLWLLSRTPQIPPEQKQRFIDKASALGFAADKLIWVDQRAPEDILQ